MAADPPPSGQSSIQQPSPAPIGAQIEARWRGQEYGDMTKLRELSAEHSSKAAKAQARASKFQVKIDRIRHAATTLRERCAAILHENEAFRAQVATLNGQITAANAATPGGAPPTSNVTRIQIRARKFQQKIANNERRAAGLELKAARLTQRASELKVRSDGLLQIARSAEQEARAYRARADQLQLASEGRLAQIPSGTNRPPPP